jgi:hypothetical protein
MRTALVDQDALLGPVLDPHRLATREFGLRQVPAALEEHASAERPPGARREETIEVRPGLRGQLLRRVRHARASDWSVEGSGSGAPIRRQFSCVHRDCGRLQGSGQRHAREALCSRPELD